MVGTSMCSHRHTDTRTHRHKRPRFFFFASGDALLKEFNSVGRQTTGGPVMHLMSCCERVNFFVVSCDVMSCHVPKTGCLVS